MCSSRGHIQPGVFFPGPQATLAKTSLASRQKKRHFSMLHGRKLFDLQMPVGAKTSDNENLSVHAANAGSPVLFLFRALLVTAWLAVLFLLTLTVFRRCKSVQLSARPLVLQSAEYCFSISCSHILMQFVKRLHEAFLASVLSVDSR